MKIGIYKGIISEVCLDAYLVSEQLQNVPPYDSKLEYNYYPVTRVFIYNLECPLHNNVLWISCSEGDANEQMEGEIIWRLIFGFDKLIFAFNRDNMDEFGTYKMDILLF